MTPPRAILCDVYRTILKINDPPIDAGAQWKALSARTFGPAVSLTLENLSGRCIEIIQNDHLEARRFGIAHPEVCWPSVVGRALPELSSCGDADAFLFQHMQLLRTLRLMPGAAEFLGKCRASGLPLGIISNAQNYTLRELDEALRPAGLSRGDFRPDLTFWSFEHGFSKPDPHAFRILAARLNGCGIDASETLIIGDREDNDIIPAREQGFQTWLFEDSATRGWAALGRAIDQAS